MKGDFGVDENGDVLFNDVESDSFTLRMDKTGSHLVFETTWDCYLDAARARTLGRLLIRYADDGDLSGAAEVLASDDDGNTDPVKVDAVEARLRALEAGDERRLVGLFDRVESLEDGHRVLRGDYDHMRNRDGERAETIADLTRRLDAIDDSLDEINRRDGKRAASLVALQDRMKAVEDGLTTIQEIDLKPIYSRLEGLEYRVTGSQCENVATRDRLDVVDSRLEAVEDRIASLEYDNTTPDFEREPASEPTQTPAPEKTPQQLADEMSERFPIGTPVLFHPVGSPLSECHKCGLIFRRFEPSGDRPTVKVVGAGTGMLHTADCVEFDTEQKYYRN